MKIADGGAFVFVARVGVFLGKKSLGSPKRTRARLFRGASDRGALVPRRRRCVRRGERPRARNRDRRGVDGDGKGARAEPGGRALGVGVQSAGTDPVIVVEGDPQAHTLGDFDERDADGSGDDDDGSIFSFDDDESGDGSDAESRSDFDEEDEEDEGVARPASFAEIVDDDVDVDEAPNLSV